MTYQKGVAGVSKDRERETPSTRIKLQYQVVSILPLRAYEDFIRVSVCACSLFICDVCVCVCVCVSVLCSSVMCVGMVGGGCGVWVGMPWTIVVLNLLVCSS